MFASHVSKMFDLNNLWAKAKSTNLNLNNGKWKTFALFGAELLVL